MCHGLSVAMTFFSYKCFSQFFLNGSLGHFFVSEMLAPMFNAAAPWFLNSNIREWTWHNKMKKIGDNNFSTYTLKISNGFLD